MTQPKTKRRRTASKIERMAAERAENERFAAAERARRFTTYQSTEDPNRPPVTLPRLRFMEDGR